nr:ADM_HP1_G0031360.mRNA.1.CDS.1 [Saccharomyces cerevisiae]
MSYSFLEFGLTKLNIFFLYGIDIFLPRGECSQYGYARDVKRCSSSVLLGWPESIVSGSLGSIARGGIAAKMMRNTKNTWKTSSHIMGTL